MRAFSVVALRKESVDRNFDHYEAVHSARRSLSARRAWIEIADYCLGRRPPGVALRKESVDRNRADRRGWQGVRAVALRKESVDRNSSAHLRMRYQASSLSARRAWIEIL